MILTYLLTYLLTCRILQRIVQFLCHCTALINVSISVQQLNNNVSTLQDIIRAIRWRAASTRFVDWLRATTVNIQRRASVATSTATRSCDRSVPVTDAPTITSAKWDDTHAPSSVISTSAPVASAVSPPISSGEKLPIFMLPSILVSVVCDRKPFLWISRVYC